MSHRQQEIARSIFREIAKIHFDEALALSEKINALYELLLTAFVEATREEQIHFSTAFARMAFVAQKYKFNGHAQYLLHSFRRKCSEVRKKPDTAAAQLLVSYQLGFKVTTESVALVFSAKMPPELANELPPDGFFHVAKVEIVAYQAKIRVFISEDDTQNEQFIGVVEATGASVRIAYNLTDRNENFMPTVKAVRKMIGFPVTMNLLEVETDDKGILRPRAFVIEPDYLADVTSIAECFKATGCEPLAFLVRRFMPISNNKALIMGNIANAFLDALMVNADIAFKDVFGKIFRLYPLTFAQYSDQEVRELSQNAQKHFLNLQEMVKNGFTQHGVDAQNSYIEPAFFSETYGIQGRLDIFAYNKNKRESSIIELKSGKIFRPNIHGINNNHYIQTLLYDLLVTSVFGNTIDPKNFILYSGIETNHLRYAPVVKIQQYEALQVRNQLIAIENALAKIRPDALDKTNILYHLRASRLPSNAGFEKADFELFEKVFYQLDETEKKYVSAFCGFIAREQLLAKTGVQGNHNANGQAALWRDELAQKEGAFSIISYLVIKKEPITPELGVVFRKTSRTNPLANFRVGDIGIMYPFRKEGDNVLSNQVLKCVITAMTSEEIKVQLRFPQFNSSIFEEETFWNIEHDLLDSGFMTMYRGLFEFAQAPKYRREWLLGINAPSQPIDNETITHSENIDLTKEQSRILQKIIHSKDYFLLWGPPGTGKTSQLLKYAVKHYFENSDENILLLAYTNRAVDEMCEAIENIGGNIKEKYFRLGGAHSTSPAYRGQLIETKLGSLTTRKELLDWVQSHRIVVATVSSLLGKLDLLDLKTFHRVMIDEASQILEPMLVGLLPRFEHFTLIGDHRQLPAVVVQSKIDTAVQDDDLAKIGIKDLSDSLFERLYRTAQAQNWTWAYDRLSHQGRMHLDIMDFPNLHFYNGLLRILPKEVPVSQFQTQEVTYQLPHGVTDIERKLINNRVVFFSTPAGVPTHKINRHEATLIGEILQGFKRIYETNGKRFSPEKIGVITPYRAQIAQVRQAILHLPFATEGITIDTVERYQGGARDIIILSLCTNSAAQIETLVSLSEEGIDRKLNVALTRARQHLIVIGNAEILQQNAVYADLIVRYGL
jgi:DNA replication ATP-dependent helicase Dna2